MEFTYDLNASGCLILTANASEREWLEGLRNESGEFDYRAEDEVLAQITCGTELDTISPEEIGALTSAPILGLRDDKGEPTAAWAFMDYAIRSFIQDLIDNGKAVFVS